MSALHLVCTRDSHGYFYSGFYSGSDRAVSGSIKKVKGTRRKMGAL